MVQCKGAAAVPHPTTGIVLLAMPLFSRDGVAESSFERAFFVISRSVAKSCGSDVVVVVLWVMIVSS